MIIKARVRKWGNSLGIIIPKEVAEIRKMKPNSNVEVMILEKRPPLAELFGLLKGRIKKPTQQIKDELRKELYND